MQEQGSGYDSPFLVSLLLEDGDPVRRAALRRYHCCYPMCRAVTEIELSLSLGLGGDLAPLSAGQWRAVCNRHDPAVTEKPGYLNSR